MSYSTGVSAMPDTRGAKNEHNEAERQQSNIDRINLDLDDSVMAKVRKTQRQGTTLLGFDVNAPTELKPLTTRR